MRYTSSLTSIEMVGRQLQKAVPGVIGTPADAQYTEFYAFMGDVLPGVDDIIFTECGVSFVPYKSTYNLNHRALAANGLYDPRTGFLWLPDDMMVASEITWGGAVLSASDYLLYPANEATAWGLTFDTGVIPAFTPGTFSASTSINATWGYHTNTSQMYEAVGANITVADTTTTVINVSNAALFEIYSYIKVESELMQVTSKAINTAPTEDTITVIRGANGHTAAAHTAQPAYRYHPVRGIEMAATRMCAYLYQKRLDVGGAVQIGDAAFLLDSLPAVVKDAIRARRKLVFGHV